MEVITPRIVFDELGQRAPLTQELVDDLDDPLLVDFPEAPQLRPELANRAQFLFVVGAAPGPLPCANELVEGADVRQTVGLTFGVDESRRTGEALSRVISKNSLDS